MRTEYEYVYVIASADPEAIKIGFSNDPFARLATFQTGCPQRLVLIGCFLGGRRLELALHERYEEWRIDSTEWFAVPRDQWEFVFVAITELVGFGEYGEPEPVLLDDPLILDDPLSGDEPSPLATIGPSAEWNAWLGQS